MSLGCQVQPLILWNIYSSGDTYNSTGIVNLISEIQDAFPGITAYSVYIEEDEDKDRKASWVRILYYLLVFIRLVF